ncbi:hypothetical protein [Nodularia sp. UHCC 0506]|uniref:hypothetical protein n=1 Tax=Nodularia sp. UHCC 0506 TaxID=3110243 RepID=UPI002B20D47E|nr:hypothetical protein [Nodularia sp. UHCC 0506]MEA5517290.1 hypothetical protein [Nodularia sp. UHCC 0506]
MIQNQVEGKFFSRPLKGCSLPIGNQAWDVSNHLMAIATIKLRSLAPPLARSPHYQISS